MAKETILIGCRLPNGVIIAHPQNRAVTVKISGTNGEKLDSGIYLPPKAFATTEVDAEFWAAWKAGNAGFPPLKNRALFEARSDQEASAKAKEVKKERTGFEQMSQTASIDGVKMERATI